MNRSRDLVWPKANECGGIDLSHVQFRVINEGLNWRRVHSYGGRDRTGIVIGRVERNMECIGNASASRLHSDSLRSGVWSCTGQQLFQCRSEADRKAKEAPG